MIDGALQERLHRAADAVAERFKPLIQARRGGDEIGVAMLLYWDGPDVAYLMPEAGLITQAKARWCRTHGQIDLLWRLQEPSEFVLLLDVVDVYETPDLLAACEPLIESLDGLDERLELHAVNAYFRALSSKVHQLTGLVVVVDSWDDIIELAADDQVLAQLDQQQAAEWRAAGWLT
jgi:hypothetical protein